MTLASDLPRSREEPTGTTGPSTEPVDAARRRFELPGVGAFCNPIARRLFVAVVFFIPVQIELGGGFESRFAPSDLFLASALVIAPSVFRLRRRSVDLLPVLLIVVLCYGVLLSVIQTGGVNNHTLIVKLFGGVALALLAVVAATVTRAGHADLLVKSFLVGMAFWAVVAYIDWRIFDIFPFIEGKTDTRFGAMQYDPNNAGAGYGVALIVSWKVGRRVFRHRASHLLCAIANVLALGLTLSRGGYVSTVATALVLVVFVDRPSARQVVRSLVVVVMLGVVAVVTGFAGAAIDDFTNRPDTVGDREQLADAGLTDFVNSHGFGIGLGTYRADYDQILHNTGLWLLVEMSVVGLVFMVAMVVIPFVGAHRLRRTDPALGSALFGAHLVMVVASQNIEAMYQRPWWLVIGIIAGTTALANPHVQCLPRSAHGDCE